MGCLLYLKPLDASPLLSLVFCGPSSTRGTSTRSARYGQAGARVTLSPVLSWCGVVPVGKPCGRAETAPGAPLTASEETRPLPGPCGSLTAGSVVDKEAWHAAVHLVAQSWTQLSN